MREACLPNRVKAGLTVIGIGVLVALVALGGYYSSGGALEEETLSLDDSKANLDSSSGGGAYRIDLEHREEGERVVVAWTFLDRLNGTLTVHHRAGLDAKMAPSPDAAVMRVDGEAGEFTFTAAEAGDYSLVVEADGATTPKGRILIQWDPPAEPGRNPVFLGAARAVLVLTLPLGVLMVAASWWRGRRNPLR